MIGFIFGYMLGSLDNEYSTGGDTEVLTGDINRITKRINRIKEIVNKYSDEKIN